MSANKHRQDRVARWAQTLEQQRHSGQGVAAFCRAQGLSISNFYRWREQLGQPAARRAASELSSAVAVTPGFVDLGTVGAAPSRSGDAVALAAGLSLRIELGAGVVLHLERR